MFFEKVSPAPIDPVFGLDTVFQNDPRAHKVYLCVGFYQDEKGGAYPMECVTKARKKILEERGLAKYLPPFGYENFLHYYVQLILGENFYKENSLRISVSQTLGGTAALRIGGEFFLDWGISTIFLPTPTWGNHKWIFERAGLKVQFYDYFDETIHRVDFEKMKNFLQSLPEKSCVLLQASCHNPSGADLEKEQWLELSKIFHEKKLLPFFDLAYQGLGKGIEEDVFSIRTFAEEGHEFFIAATCSKNFSMYCERVGAIIAISPNKKIRDNVFSQINRVIRGIYSNPPLYGARVVYEILSDENLKKTWENELLQIRLRLKKNREDLSHALQSFGGNMDFIKTHCGMFSLLSLTKEQVTRLKEEFAIYILSNSRINFAGINSKNLQYVAKALSLVIK